MTKNIEAENFDEGWTKIDGLYYWDDQNHSGTAWVTEEMVKKYGMEGEDTIEEYYADEEMVKEMWEGVEGNYTHAIWIHHCCGVSKGKTEEDYRNMDIDTPHGECGSIEFVSWWLGYPGLFNEPEENVLVFGWCDG